MGIGDGRGEWSVSGPGPHLVVIDNHDSFTYNLVQAFNALGARVTVRLSDRVTVDDLIALAPDRLVLSPGPGSPEDARISDEALAHFRGRRPVLGVCLGYQVLARQLGATVAPSGEPVHGKSCQVSHDGQGIFCDMPMPFPAARYHSLVVVEETIPEGLKVVGRDQEGNVMAIAVPGEATWGVQFHPESFLTPEGNVLLAAFLSGVSCPFPEEKPLAR